VSLQLLNDVLDMLDATVVSGGRLDFTCHCCGGDDGDLGGDREVIHATDCAYLALRARLVTALTVPA
jgi:hypothetical protein